MYIPFRPLDNILKYTYQYITFGHGLFNNIPTLFFLKIANVNFISIYFSNTIVVLRIMIYIIPILPRSQHISCWLVLFDAWMKVLATPSSSSYLQKRILHFGGSYYPFVNMHKNSPQKFWDFGAVGRRSYALASSNWKTDM